MYKKLTIGSYLIVGLLLAPLLVVFSSIAQFESDVWQHLTSTVLSEYILNSLLLALGTGIGVVIVGTTLAWLMVRYDFRGKSILYWLILLPLAMPAYIIAYTYTGSFDFSSPLQVHLRMWFDLADSARVLPDIRNLVGATVMMILVLYPYVYLLARSAFKEQSPQFELVGKLANKSKFKMLFTVYLPLARPAIFTGAALAMMESLADYGTVAYFGVSTFTTGIYRTWFGMGDLNAASQLASMLCFCVLVVLLVEKNSRRHAERFQSRHHQVNQARRIYKLPAFIVFMVCLLPALFGFILPFFQLFYWAWAYFEWSNFVDYLPTLWTSLKLAGITTLVIVSCALFIAFTRRLTQSRQLGWPSQIASLGYALPGIVIAVGVVQVAGMFDLQLNQVLNKLFDYQPGLVMSGSLAILVFAYAIRYMSVGMHNIETGLERIKSNIDEVSMSLGATPKRMLANIHLPLLKSSLLSAAILVFVDVLKELPATLILRPFNVNTLAVKAYELASDERLIDAALPAISIVLAGILPIFLLTRSLEKVTR